MRIQALATDYDETIAHAGIVPEETLRAMERFRASGRKLILDTGRGLEDLLSVFPETERFDALVLENGAVLGDPVTRAERLLADPPSPKLLQELRRRGIPIPKRRVVLDTWGAYRSAVVDALREAGIDMHMVFNKDSMLVLPEGVDKASGLRAALEPWGIPLSATAAVGDAQNDYALLDCAGYRFAVPNAIPELQEKAHRLLDVPALIEEILNRSEERDWDPRGLASPLGSGVLRDSRL